MEAKTKYAHSTWFIKMQKKYIFFLNIQCLVDIKKKKMNELFFCILRNLLVWAYFVLAWECLVDSYIWKIEDQIMNLENEEYDSHTGEKGEFYKC